MPSTALQSAGGNEAGKRPRVEQCIQGTHCFSSPHGGQQLCLAWEEPVKAAQLVWS